MSSLSSSLLSARFPSLTSDQCACLMSVAGDVDSAAVLARCSGSNTDTASRISLCGSSAGHCGYCNGSRRGTRSTFGLIAESLDVDDYDQMIHRGFRRSGNYCYAASPTQTADMCCAQYAIRVDSKRFKANKSQRNTANKIRRFTQPQPAATPPPSPKRARRSCNVGGAVNEVRSALESFLRSIGADDAVITSTSSKTRVYTRDDVNATTNAATIVVAEYKERALADIGGALAESIKRTATARITDATFDERSGQIKLILASSDIAEADMDRDVPPPLVLLSPPTPTPTPTHSLQVTMCPSAFDAESFSLYCRYQTAVHGDAPDELSERAYTRFLCKSPLTSAAPPYGSFHQRYRFDGKLIAVSVIDILPTCVSSVYVFYDPAFALFSLGVATALRDIETVRTLNTAFPRLQYYVLGLYIHSCNKMRYKADYAPAELLCPLRLSWHEYALCKPLLDAHDVVIFSDAATQQYCFDRHKLVEHWNVRVKLAREYIRDIPLNLPPRDATNVVRVRTIQNRIRGEFEQRLVEYAAIVGKTLAHKLLLSV